MRVPRRSRVSAACAVYAPACLSTMKKSHISHNRIMNADRCASLGVTVCTPEVSLPECRSFSLLLAGPVRFAVVNRTRAGPQTVARKEPKDILF